jgi:CheY-like chemotaxis protein
MINDLSQPVSFTREETEHAYTRLRRMRTYSQALAELAAQGAAAERADRVAEKAVAILDVRACVIQRLGAQQEFETLALRRHDDLSAGALGLIAAHAGMAVIRERKVLNIANLLAHYPNERMLIGAGVASYLGIPLLGQAGAVIGVATLFGGLGREFSEEEEWWLQAATQPIADAMEYAALEEKAQRLERKLERKLAPPAASDTDSEAGPGRLSILVVEDDRPINMLLSSLLKREGYRVDSAFDGLEAMRMFKPAEHDVLLTDLSLPLMNGWELAAALHEQVPELPVVIITGCGNGDWNEAFLRKQGVVAVLSKPFDKEQLRAVLREIAAQASNPAAH